MLYEIALFLSFLLAVLTFLKYKKCDSTKNIIDMMAKIIMISI